MVDRAYALAYFVLRRRDLALRAATEALARLDVAMLSQDKRLYYRPAQPEGLHRSKILLGEKHQLQRLVYIACEPHELAIEQGQFGEPPSPEDLVVHFIKQLVRITIRRNAFHVVLGVCRLLFNYSTSETMELHNQLVDNPEDVKDESYYRARKAVLLKEMAGRFAGLVTLVRHPRGEERFRSCEDSRRFFPLVASCLERFAPWDVPCAGAPGQQASGEVEPELERIHGALHPPCLERLVAALALASPKSRLELPHLSLPAARDHSDSPGGGRKEDDMTRDRSQPPPLRPEEQQGIESFLERESRARRRAPGDLLRILLDGRECARLDLTESGELSLLVPDGAETLEVRAGEPGHDLLLATALLEDEPGRPQRQAITLEAGQHLSLQLGRATGAASRRITLRYRETGPWRALRLAARRAAGKRRTWQVGFSAVALAAVGIVALELRPPGSDSTLPPVLEVTTPRPAPAPASPPDQVALRRSGVEATAPAVTDLRDVTRIFIASSGPDPLRQAAIDAVTRRLAGTRFTLVGEEDNPDAALKIEVTAKASRKAGNRSVALESRPVRLLVRLVNAAGTILWPRGLARGGRVFHGSPLGVSADQIVRELLADPEARR
jgi:hypothetical protein